MRQTSLGIVAVLPLIGLVSWGSVFLLPQPGLADAAFIPSRAIMFSLPAVSACLEWHQGQLRGRPERVLAYGILVLASGIAPAWLLDEHMSVTILEPVISACGLLGV